MLEESILASLRAEIRNVTLEIISLTGQRMKLVEKIAYEKMKSGIPVVNSEVEAHLRDAVISRCQNEQIDSDSALNLLNRLIINSIQQQKKSFEKSVTHDAYSYLMKARELESQGSTIIHLEVGEPDFGPPELVNESLKSAIDSGFTKYSESAGLCNLRESISNYLKSLHGIEFNTNQIVVTPGGRFGLFLALAASIVPGDEVVIIDPSYPAYSELVCNLGGRPIHLPTLLEDNWDLDFNNFESLLNETTKVVIINSPSNPTGKVLDISSLRGIVKLSEVHGFRIISDEVYSRFSQVEHESVLQFPESNHVFVDSFSKTYGMTGFRLGYAVSHEEVIERMRKLQKLYLTSTPEFIQIAGIQALKCKKEELEFVRIIEKRRQIMSDLLRKMSVEFYQPDGGFYLFVRIKSDLMTGLSFAEKLLNDHGVAVVPGNSYGVDYADFVRLSLCQPEEKLRLAAASMMEVLS